MIDIDVKQLRELEKDLLTFRAKAFPFAVRGTLNSAAFETRGRAQEAVRSEMILRNKHTERSIRVETAKGVNVDSMAARVGSDADYMYRQEFGGQAPKKPIATSFAAGQDGARPRTKLPTKPNQMQQIQLRNRVKNAASPRQEAFLRGLIAAREGDKFVYIPGRTGASSGIYRVWGRNRKKGKFRSIKLRMVWSMRKTPTKTPKNSWLLPATRQVGARKRMQTIYRDQLLQQLRRHQVLGY